MQIQTIGETADPVCHELSALAFCPAVLNVAFESLDDARHSLWKVSVPVLLEHMQKSIDDS